MDSALRYRFATLAVLLLIVVGAGLASLPVLRQCCPDPPGLWPEGPHRSFVDTVLFMDTVPRLAALAAAAGTVSLPMVAVIYVLTAKAEAREAERRPPGYFDYLRVIAGSFVVGVFYLYALLLPFQLGWWNLLWIVGVPLLLAALIGRAESERKWSGMLLIVPGFFVLVALMMALGISPY